MAFSDMLKMASHISYVVLEFTARSRFSYGHSYSWITLGHR